MRTRPMFVFGTQVCTSLADGAGADREWLCSDGTGGYALGTVAGLRTRRQHALLVTPDRMVALVTLDPVVTLTSGARVELGVHEWVSGAVAPQGHHLLESFDLTDGLPRWRWRVGDVVVERELAMERDRSGVAVVHRVVSAPGPVGLALGALCTWRHADGERTAAGPPPDVEQVADGVVVERAYRIAGPGWRPDGVWWYGARTRRDGAREDLWHAGTFTARLAPGEALEVCAWAGDLARQPSATAVVAAARVRARKVVAAAKPADALDAHLALAADAHIVAGPRVVDGYPGAADGNVLAGYEGLFLETGRAAEGRALLQGYRGRTLWYPHAVERHVTRTGDTDLAAALLPALSGLLGEYVPDPADGLLVGDLGRPVGLNALWVNALGAVARLHELTGDDPTGWLCRYDAARTGFAKRYPAPDGWLYDVVDVPPPPYPLAGSLPYDDPALRPHQVLAWSLPYAPLDATGPEPLGAVGAHLLTPLGLRSLAAHEYGYRGTHRGDGDRDQGAVWPWLVGAYVDACRAAGLPTDRLVAGLESQVGEYGLGSVSELADGDPPHRPGGAPFHARSVAELLRARRVLAGQ